MSKYIVPSVWNSLPSGISACSPSHIYHRLLKTYGFEQAFSSPSGSHKCLRFGLWLTLRTIYKWFHLLTYLLTENYIGSSRGSYAMPCMSNACCEKHAVGIPCAWASCAHTGNYKDFSDSFVVCCWRQEAVQLFPRRTHQTWPVHWTQPSSVYLRMTSMHSAPSNQRITHSSSVILKIFSKHQ